MTLQSDDCTVFFFTVAETYKPIGFIETASPVVSMEWSNEPKVIGDIERFQLSVVTANQKKEKYLQEPMRSQSKTDQKWLKRGKTRATKSWLVFSFAFDWLKVWLEFFGPITERDKAKTKQTWIIFDTQLKLQ